MLRHDFHVIEAVHDIGRRHEVVRTKLLSYCIQTFHLELGNVLESVDVSEVYYDPEFPRLLLGNYEDGAENCWRGRAGFYALVLELLLDVLIDNLKLRFGHEGMFDPPAGRRFARAEE
jgi:hypothetical protein